MTSAERTVMPGIQRLKHIYGFAASDFTHDNAITPQNEKEKTEESRASPPLSLYIDSRIFLVAACSMSCFASSLLPRSADTMI